MPELYFSLHVPRADSPQSAITALRSACLARLEEARLPLDSLVLLRVFCSDVFTQAPLLEQLWPLDVPCQRVCIGQAPLDSAFLSLQAYAIAGLTEKRLEQDGSLVVRHGDYLSLWTLDSPAAPADAERQSDAVIASLRNKLQRFDMALERDVMRTWYYLRDVDNNYAGMIRSRIRQYEAVGLTPRTHFIASTGIEASAPRPDALVWLHSHAEKGLLPEQVTWLKAAEHLSPTHVYGVNFERATRIVYGDRAHCRISGTASIDREGRVLHTGNVLRQFERAVENVEALLHEGGMEPRHLRAATIYLRDPHDAPRLAPLARKLLPADCAVNITRGSVCRPDWLVEIEAEGIAPWVSAFPPFG